MAIVSLSDARARLDIATDMEIAASALQNAARLAARAGIELPENLRLVLSDAPAELETMAALLCVPVYAGEPA